MENNTLIIKSCQNFLFLSFMWRRWSLVKWFLFSQPFSHVICMQQVMRDQTAVVKYSRALVWFKLTNSILAITMKLLNKAFHLFTNLLTSFSNIIEDALWLINTWESKCLFLRSLNCSEPQSNAWSWSHWNRFINWFKVMIWWVIRFNDLSCSFTLIVYCQQVYPESAKLADF